MTINKITTLDELFEIAKKTLNHLDEGEEFVLKELFRGFEWSRVAIGNRTKLGSMFYNYAKGEGHIYIKPTKKTPQNQQQYIKLNFNK